MQSESSQWFARWGRLARSKMAPGDLESLLRREISAAFPANYDHPKVATVATFESRNYLESLQSGNFERCK